MSDFLANSPPKLIIFDLFGTLVKYGVMHHPFRKLLKWARDNGRRPEPDDALKLMTINAELPTLVAALGISAPEWLLEQIQQEILEELGSLTLYDDAIAALSALAEQNTPFAICSNLAFPYGDVLGRLLGNYKFMSCMSYEVGFIKPDPEIYRFIVDTALVTPGECLFIGDTFLADYEGPQQFGMRARHLVRDKPRSGYEISLLTDVLDIFN
jgi:HAD superfamily hydrolase (TIGR01549 family)